MDSSVPNNSMSDRKAASEAKRSILNPFKGLKSLNSRASDRVRGKMENSAENFAK